MWSQGGSEHHPKSLQSSNLSVPALGRAFGLSVGAVSNESGAPDALTRARRFEVSSDSSSLRQSAVDDELGRRGVARLVRGEEERGRRKLIRPSDATQ